MKKIVLILVMVVLWFLVGWAAWMVLTISTEVLRIPEWPLNPVRTVWFPVYMGVMIAVIAILVIIALSALYTLFSLRRR
jgi:hypothetical protein